MLSSCLVVAVICGLDPQKAQCASSSSSKRRSAATAASEAALVHQWKQRSSSSTNSASVCVQEEASCCTHYHHLLSSWHRNKTSCAVLVLKPSKSLSKAKLIKQEIEEYRLQL